ncbi:hypothetical protein [Paraburkholderia kirstenboschensis]|uniref:hypothetical protein n=1 Tax=Paraburkholderia kirstenboschensis TaxID=1245436 RepID=UPI000A7889B6|nr:hypothetical protein [Paraburkholderia kirstenboschensis]
MLNDGMRREVADAASPYRTAIFNRLIDPFDAAGKTGELRSTPLCGIDSRFPKDLTKRTARDRYKEDKK